MATPSRLLPGYKFCPSAGELIVHYLKNKILGEALPLDCIPTVDVYSQNPEQLPLPTRSKWRIENEWYFFTIKPSNNLVIETNDGFYVQSEEMEDIIYQGDEEVGYMSTLVYYQGKRPSGKKTKWTIYEFRVNPEIIPASQHDETLRAKVSNFVACKVVDEKEKKKMKD